MDNILDYLQTAAVSAGKIILEITYIIFLVMLLLETLKALKILNKINDLTYKFTKHLGITPSANFPLLVGLIIGISYGAGAIINSYRNKMMTKKDVLLVSVFLSLCHAIIEDTILFAKIGANIFVLVFARLFVAIIATYVMNKILVRKEKKHESY